jgi:hypothetical protein
VLPKDAPAALPIFGCADYLENFLNLLIDTPKLLAYRRSELNSSNRALMMTNHVARATHAAAISIRNVFRSKPTTWSAPQSSSHTHQALPSCAQAEMERTAPTRGGQSHPAKMALSSDGGRAILDAKLR